MHSNHGYVDANDSKGGGGHHIETQDSGPSCRHCYESSEESSKLLKPCNCKGSIEFIHFNCLKEWIEHNNTDVCDVCKTSYDGLVITSSSMQ